MNLSWLKKPTAWQPLTFHGVAEFAAAPLRRLMLVQLIVALLAASIVVWFLDNAWFPTVQAAILQMPAKGEIRDGKLDWTNETPSLLARGRFLAVISDLNHRGDIRVPAHIQVELGRGTVRLISLLGYCDLPYPQTHWILVCNRTDLEPWWGAWRPPILWISFAAVALGLMLIWCLLATLLFGPVWLIGFYANRELSFWGSWKLAGAALMPGALLITGAIVSYGFGVLDLVQLGAAQLVHFVMSCVFCSVSPLFAPDLKKLPAGSKNPFQQVKSESGGAEKK